MAKILNYRVIIEQDEDGVFIASSPALQGCYTEGETYEEVIRNIEDAIKLHIEARKCRLDFFSAKAEFLLYIGTPII